MSGMMKVFVTMFVAVMFVAAVAAQQPAPAATKPGGVAETKATTEAVLDQLRGTAPTPATGETPSVQTIIDRYQSMITTGAQAGAARTPATGTSSASPASTTKPPARNSPDTQVDSIRPSKDDEVRRIITELRALLARLEAVVGDER